MGSIFFVLKCLLLTVVLVVLMQIRIGGTTLEEKAPSLDTQFICDSTHSAGRRWLREGFAPGLENRLPMDFSPVFKMGWQRVASERSLKVNWERSEKVISEQAKKAKEKAKS